MPVYRPASSNDEYRALRTCNFNATISHGRKIGGGVARKPLTFTLRYSIVGSGYVAAYHSGYRVMTGFAPLREQAAFERHAEAVVQRQSGYSD